MFEIGKMYRKIDIFTGGETWFTVIDRTEDTVTVSEFHHELDGDHDCGSTTFSIKKDGDCEYISFGSYHGHENVLLAE